MLSRLSLSFAVASKRAAVFPTAVRPVQAAAMTTAAAQTSVDTQAPPQTRITVKPLASRKTYLVDSYAHLLKSSPVVLVVHHNNLVKADNNNLRGLIKKAGGQLTITRSRLFKVALRAKDHEDPASKDAQLTLKREKHPLAPLFAGPSAVITFPELDPKKVEAVVNVIDKSKGNLTLLGSLIDNQVLSVPEVNKFKSLPTLPELRSQLVGVLSILGGAGLVQTLEASGKVLYLTMDERRKQLDPSEAKEAEAETESKE